MADFQRRLKKLNRLIHRCTNVEEGENLKTERNALRKSYRKCILQSKELAWRKFIDTNRPWGKPYKVVLKKRERIEGVPRIKRPDGQLTGTDSESSAAMLRAKFPELPEQLQGICNPVPVRRKERIEVPSPVTYETE